MLYPVQQAGSSYTRMLYYVCCQDNSSSTITFIYSQRYFHHFGFEVQTLSEYVNIQGLLEAHLIYLFISLLRCEPALKL